LSDAASAAEARSAGEHVDDGRPRRREAWHDPHAEAANSFSLGEAALHGGRACEAGARFASARAVFEAGGDHVRALECSDKEASALLAQEKPTALTVADKALRRASTLPELPDGTKARLLCLKGDALLAHHEWQGATACLRGAFGALGRVVDLAWLAHLYRGLALVQSTLGDPAGGRAYAARSHLLPPTAWPADAVRAGTILGVALARSGAPDEAEAMLYTALELADEHALAAARASCVLGLAELAWMRGRLTQTDALAREAAANARASHARFSLADAHVWRARVGAARGDDDKAARLFEAALEILEELGVVGRRVECHAELARHFEGRSRLDDALGHWKAAARLGRPRREAGRPGFAQAPAPGWFAELVFTRSFERR
jgi:tetratricopeptide (TPR) repeat protein